MLIMWIASVVGLGSIIDSLSLIAIQLCLCFYFPLNCQCLFNIILNCHFYSHEACYHWWDYNFWMLLLLWEEIVMTPRGQKMCNLTTEWVWKIILGETTKCGRSGHVVSPHVNRQLCLSTLPIDKIRNEVWKPIASRCWNHLPKFWSLIG